jgi:hypothetical protein
MPLPQSSEQHRTHVPSQLSDDEEFSTTPRVTCHLAPRTTIGQRSMSSSFKSRTTNTTMPIWPSKNFLGSARPVGKLANTYDIACTMHGYPTAHVSSCDKLSKGFRCRYIKVGNMAMRMRGRERGCAESSCSSSFHACISRSSLPFHRCSESGFEATVGVSSW